MGASAGTLRDRLGWCRKAPAMEVVMIGLDSAGKTSLLYPQQPTGL